MIFVDYNRYFLATAFSIFKLQKFESTEDTKNLYVYALLQGLISYNKQFKAKYGNLCICRDDSSKTYWRKQVFPYYKIKRNISKDSFDLKFIFDTARELFNDLKLQSSFQCVSVPGLEADDCIGVLTKNKIEQSLIISSDKDYKQLLKYSHVHIFDPLKKNLIEKFDATRFLEYHILSGDSSDCIPNVLSDDDCIAIGKRQTPLRDTMKEKLAFNISNFPKYQKNYDRNRLLIDFNSIPEKFQEDILQEYEDSKNSKRIDKMNLLLKFRQNRLLEEVTNL